MSDDDRWSNIGIREPRYTVLRLIRVWNGRGVRHPKAKLRRDQLRDQKRCINSGVRSRVVHGKPYRAGKCFRCVEVHKLSR